MRRTLLSFISVLSVLAVSATSAYAQHRGGGGFGCSHGGFGGGHGGFGGGFGGYHPAMRPMPMSRTAPQYHPGTPNLRRAGPAPAPTAREPYRPHPVGSLNAAKPSSRPNLGIKPAPSARPNLGIKPAPSARPNLAQKPRPSSRPGLGQGIASNRPSKPSNGELPAKPSNRIPGKTLNNGTSGSLAQTSRPGKPGNIGKPPHKNLTGLQLDDTASVPPFSNADIIVATSLTATRIGTGAAEALDAALASKPLTDAQIAQLQNAKDTLPLTPAQKATIQDALDHDQQVKQALANANNGPGGNGGNLANVLASLLGGGGSGGGGSGGCAGSGGGCAAGGGDGGCPAGGSGDGCPPVMMGPVADATAATADDTGSEDAGSTEADDSGVRIDAVTKGAPADVAGLRTGDVIIRFGGVPTRTFEDLQNAVQQASGPVKVVFINAENNAVEYLMVEPQDGRIGVTCE